MSSAIAFSSSSLLVSESSPSLHLERKAVERVTILRIPRCTSVSQTVHQQEKNRVPEKSVNPTSSEDAKPKSNRRSMVKSSLAAAAAIGVSAAEKRQARAATAAATCQVSSSSLGIDFCDSVEGNGITVEKGMVIKAHYTGRLTTGSVFDSSYNRGKPLVFKVGVGEVIRGWDQGILGGGDMPPMKAGGKRTLKIPAELAYGARGAGCRGTSCSIPPNSTLVFDIEFLGKA